MTRQAPTLQGRLVVVFSALITLLAIGGASCVVALDLSTRAMTVIQTHITPALEAQQAGELQIRQIQATARLATATSGPATISVDTQRHELLGRLKGITELNDDPALATAVSRERAMISTWLDQDIAPVAQGTTSTLRTNHFNDVIRGSAAIQSELVNQRHRLRNDAATFRRTSLLVIAAATALGTLLATFVVIRTVRWFSVPLREVAHALERVQAGDVHVHLSGNGPREVRLVGDAVSELVVQTQAVRASREASNRLRRGTMDGALAVREKLEWDEVVRAGLAAVAQTLGMDAAWFHPIASGTVEPSSGHWATPRFASAVDVATVAGRHAVGLGVPELTDLWSDGLVHVATNVRWVPQELGLVEGGSDAFGPGTVITVPMVAGEQLMGAMVLLHAGGPRGVTGEEVAALLVMASNVAVGLQNSKVFGAQRDLVERLQDVDRQKTAFLSNVSHELRTPLTSIAGYTEMLVDGDAGDLTDGMRQMLEAIERNTNRLGLLIDDLLAISRIESAAYRISPTTVQVADPIRHAVETITPALNRAGLTLTVADTDPLEVLADPTALERCILNLLSNAVKFTPAGGRVDLLVTRERLAGRDMVRIAVRDSGIGIPQDDLSQMFTRFFRASNAVDQEIPGTGLGLAIVRGIMEHHGGSLELESQEGAGTTVSLLLPEQSSSTRIPAQREPSGAPISGQ